MVDDPRRRPVDDVPPRPADIPPRHEDEKPTRDGDVLGLSDAPPDVKLPKPPGPSGNPAGIEVGPTSGGLGELSRGSGATGIDMGYGGTGTDINPEPSRPRSAENPEE